MRYLTVAAAAAVILLAACSSPSSSTTPPAPPHSPAASVIASRMALAGLPIRNLLIYTAAGDPNHMMGRQGGYT